ncbi:MAG: hypothetical protein RI907_3221 [Pseudomonadota bacterium]|jgi:MerR family copper efflux transcriptional regulator
MKIGELATRTGVSVDTLRFYEDKGLLTPHHRSAAGYRHYTEAAIEVVRFIKMAQSLGFALQEIGAVIPDLGGGNLKLASVRERMQTKLAALDHQITLLQAQRSELLAALNSLTCQDDTLVQVSQLQPPAA